MDAENDTYYSIQCIEHYVWKLGILFTDYGKSLIEKLAKVVTFA
jgi:hypothetical protein